MAQYTTEQLMGALRKADAAGDSEGAQRIAAMIKAQREVESQPQEPAKPVAQVAAETPMPYGMRQQAAQEYSYQTTPDQGFKRDENFVPEIGDAPELNKIFGEGAGQSWMASLGLLTSFDPEKQANVIKSQFPESEIYQNEAGETMVALPSGEYRLSGPMQDAARFAAQAVAFSPAGRAASIPGAAVASGLTEAGLQVATEQAGGGDLSAGDVLGATALGAGGKLIERGIQTAAKVAQGGPTGAQREVIEFAEEQGAPLMTSDVVQPQTFAGKSAQAAAEKIPVVGTGSQRVAQQEARSKVIEDFSNRFGEYNPEEVVQSLQRQTSKVKQAAGNARQSIMNEVSDIPVTTRNAVNAIDAEIERLGKSPTGAARQTADTATINKLEQYKADLLSDPSFENLEQLRTNFRTDVKGERMVMPSRSQSSIERIYQGMTKDMDQTIQGSLGDQQLAKWKKANTVYANEVSKLKNTRLKNVLQKGELTPEVVNNLLYSNKPSEVKSLFNSLDSRGKQQARAGLIGKAIEKSNQSPDRFLNELNKMSKQTGITFKGEDKKYLDGLKAYLESTRRAGQAGVVTPTGQELFQIAAPVGVTTDILGTGGLGTMGAAGYGLLSRAYESAPVRDLMIKLSNVKPGTQQFNDYVSSVGSILSATAQAGRGETQSTQ